MTFKKQLGIQIGIALAAVIVMVTGVQLAVGNLEGNAGRIQQQKTDLAFRIRATDQLASLKAASDKAQPLFKLLNATLPPKDELINFGQTLTQLAKSDKVDLGFTFGGEVAPKAGAPGYIPFSLTGSATYDSFQKFLKDVENSRYFVKMNSIDLVRPGAGDIYNIVASGQVYYQ